MSDTIFEQFPALPYLEKYYSYVGDENAGWLEGIVSASERLSAPNGDALEIGGGPVIAPYIAMHAAGVEIDSVTFTDYATQNLDAARSWVENSADCFDYSAITNWIVTLTGWQQGAAELEAEVRGLRWSFDRWDVADGCPEVWKGKFGVISSHFFAESATSEFEELKRFFEVMSQAAADGAMATFSFMRKSMGYNVDGIDFPAVSIDEKNVQDVLVDAGLVLDNVEISHLDKENPPTRPGYSGMFFVSGQVVRTD